MPTGLKRYYGNGHMGTTNACTTGTFPQPSTTKKLIPVTNNLY
jgi:hypothetical protein